MAKNVSHPLGVCFAENPQDDLDLRGNTRCGVAHIPYSHACRRSRTRLMGEIQLEAERLAGAAPQSTEGQTLARVSRANLRQHFLISIGVVQLNRRSDDVCRHRAEAITYCLTRASFNSSGAKRTLLKYRHSARGQRRRFGDVHATSVRGPRG